MNRLLSFIRDLFSVAHECERCASRGVEQVLDTRLVGDRWLCNWCAPKPEDGK